LPEPHNKIILDLAFDLATWHAYAKLRKHTKHTLHSLRSQSKELGRQLRTFLRDTCSKYKTKHLPGEEAARGRRRVAKAKKGSSTARKEPGPHANPAAKGDSELRPFNLATYKIHALADYADHIERFGPTDCFTTQHVCHAFSSSKPISHETSRVSLNTGESSATIGARTRYSFLAKSQNRNGYKAITASTLRPSGNEPVQSRRVGSDQRERMKARHRVNTTRHR